jgi:hypothetical protein
MSQNKDLYNASVAYEKFQNFTGIIVLVIVGTAILIGSFYLYKWQSKFIPTKGIVKSIDNPDNKCEQIKDDKGNVTYLCKFTASYDYKDNKGTVELQQTSSFPVKVGEEIDLVYNSANPEYPPTLPQVSPLLLIILCVIGVICFISAYVKYIYISNEAYQPILAAQGAISIGTNINEGLRNMIMKN